VAASFQHQGDTPLDLPAALRDPAAYPFPVRSVTVAETHISWIFLAGPFAYKVKKPVDYGFLDYSTLERRKHFCEEEVRLNRRLAPDVYLGVAPITVWGGATRVEGAGTILDYAVKMRRLPDDRLFDHLLERERVGEFDVERLARHIADFHARAESGAELERFGSRDVIALNWRENFDQTRSLVGKTITLSQFRQCYGFVASQLHALKGVFDARRREGRIRDCHGDLRCDSVCMDETGSFQVFDCIEFNERFRYCDVASEVAFMAMDLDWRGRPDLAWTWVDAYVEASGDADLRSLLPFYKCYRAFVRGKVESFESTSIAAVEDAFRHRRAAHEHFDLAETYTYRFTPSLVLMCGQVGSGKTALARGLGSLLGFAVVSTDRVRKELISVPSRQRMAGPVDQGLYSPEMRQATYEECFERAARLLRSGQSVVLDGSFGSERDRQAAANIAREAGAAIVLVHLRAPESVIYERLAARAATRESESDAGPEVFEAVRTRFESPQGWAPSELLELDASGGLMRTADLAIAGLRQRLHASHDGGARRRIA